MRNIKPYYTILFILIFFNSCSNNPLDIKVPETTKTIEFVNVDKILAESSLDEMNNEINELENTLGDLFIYELSQNLRSNFNDSSYIALHNFYNQEYIRDLEIEKKTLWDKLPEQEKSIKSGFDYFAHYFGEDLLPDNIFYINKLFSKINCSDENISIGLENYISPEATVIRSIPEEEWHQWQRDRMDIKYLDRDVLLSWIQVHLFEEIDGRFAEHIIQAGKILYILNAMFPKESEAFILRYSDEDYKWAYDNEEMIWEYMVREELLFKIDMTTRINFMNEGPKTIGLPDESPDRIGQFMGYRIVKNFMQKNKTLSLQELLETKYNNVLQTYEIK